MQFALNISANYQWQELIAKLRPESELKKNNNFAARRTAKVFFWYLFEDHYFYEFRIRLSILIVFSLDSGRQR